MYIYIFLYTHNPNDPYLEGFDPQNGRSTPQKRGQLYWTAFCPENFMAWRLSDVQRWMLFQGIIFTHVLHVFYPKKNIIYIPKPIVVVPNCLEASMWKNNQG